MDRFIKCKKNCRILQLFVEFVAKVTLNREDNTRKSLILPLVQILMSICCMETDAFDLLDSLEAGLYAVQVICVCFFFFFQFGNGVDV